MHLRARKARLSVSLECCSVTNELVRAMAYRMYGAFTASLSAVALMLAANETFAASGAAHRGGFTSTRSISHRPVAQSLRHHRRNHVGTFWPAAGDFFYGPSNGEPVGDVTQSILGDNQYTYTYDVPWDWAHRYPPLVTPSERPYVPSCPAETVTVLGHDGQEQTVNIMRCY
jgi:hypothetical protein